MSKFIEQLAQQFGKDKIKICSPHHVQVRSPNGQPHNIWPLASGQFRLQLAGHRKSSICGCKRMLAKISAYMPLESDLAQMNRALEVVEVIRRAAAIKRDCIFADAGFRDGKAKYAIIMVHGEKVCAESNTFPCPDVNTAEIVAINRAIMMRTELKVNLTVFSDSRTAVDHARQSGHQNVEWIPRERNVSDKIGNMRGQMSSPSSSSSTS